MIKNNPDLIYFDSAATSFKPEAVIDSVNDYYCKHTSNIHRGDYDISHYVSKLYDDCRKTVKQFINAADDKCIVFTSGATASLNTVAYAYGLQHLNSNDTILTTAVEHASSILPWFKVAQMKKCTVQYIPLNNDASFDIDKYEQCFINNPNIKIVALTHISNVTGLVFPIKEICQIAHKYGAIVSVDGAQSVPHIKVDVNDLDIDFLSFSSHKMCGPSGVGVLYGKEELLQKMDPLFLGGGSNARFDIDGNYLLKNYPDKYEAGTPCIEGVIGLNEAIKFLDNIGMDEIADYQSQLNRYFLGKLSQLDNIEIYNINSSSGIISFNVKGIFAQDVASYLNKNNIAVRSGNHCAKLVHNVLHVTESIRASLYFYNTFEEIDKFIAIIKDVSLEKCVDSLL